MQIIPPSCMAKQMGNGRPDRQQRLAIRSGRLFRLVSTLAALATGLSPATAMPIARGGAHATSGTANPPALRDMPRSITALHRALNAPGSSCTHLITGYLDRASRLDGRLHSLIAVSPDALAEAARLDSLPRSARHRLPLACVPLLVKDNIDVAGLATTGGSAVLTGNLAMRDADVVARLKQAGAIVLAKTNMSEFAFNFRGRSSVRGLTKSPYADTESAGGSSSGNAAALAAGLGVIALGTDTSGSMRVPSALTGTTGLRPSFGLLSREGVMGLSPSQDVVGPMCIDPADCLTVMKVLAHRALTSSKASGTHPLLGLRIGVLRAFLKDPRQAGAIDKALTILRRAGAIVLDAHLRDELVLTGTTTAAGKSAKFVSRSAFDFPDVMDHYLPERKGTPANAKALLAALRASAGKGETDPSVTGQVETEIANRDGKIGDPRFEANGPFRDDYVRERLDEAFACGGTGSCFDILLYPSVQGLFAEAEKGLETAGTHRIAAYSGRPALAFPVGATMTPAGPRPVSVEILGRAGDDLPLLLIAQAWQALTGTPRIVDCINPTGTVCLSLP